MPSVIVLKNPAGEIASDPYYNELVSRQYTPLCVPVLNHAFVNQDKLKEIISAGPSGSYGAVVVTSGRAVEAWKEVADIVANESDSRGRSRDRGRHVRSISGA